MRNAAVGPEYLRRIALNKYRNYKISKRPILLGKHNINRDIVCFDWLSINRCRHIVRHWIAARSAALRRFWSLERPSPEIA